MKRKTILLYALVVLIGIVPIACNDDFSEEDLLKKQVELGNQQKESEEAKALAALNKAGQLVSFQLKIVDTNGKPVEGLSVKMNTTSDDQVAATELTTDAGGSVLFQQVSIGGNTVDITGENIADVTLALDFGQISQGKHYQNIDGVVVPTPVVENAVVTVLSTLVETATVEGKVTIETDLTNLTPEVVEDLEVKADFSDNLTSVSSINVDYFFATNDEVPIGTATTDANGMYTLTVPAGMNFDLKVPLITTNQRLAVAKVGGVELDRPEYREAETTFGQRSVAFNSAFSAIPQVPGAILVFDEPATPGSGFTFGNFKRIGRELAFYVDATNQAITTPFKTDNTIAQFTNLGKGYENVPTITITDAGAGTGAEAEARIEVKIGEITIVTVGEGYGANSPVTVYISAKDEDANGTGSDVSKPVAEFVVRADASGKVGQNEIDAGLKEATGEGFDEYAKIDLADIDEYEVSFSNPPAGKQAEAKVKIKDGRVYAVMTTKAGKDYVNPTFTFSSGGGEEQAVLKIMSFSTQWSFDIDNSKATDYPVLPESISLSYESKGAYSSNYYSTSVITNIETGNNSNILDLLLNNNGTIEWIDKTASYKTGFFTPNPPEVVVESTSAIRAKGHVISMNFETGEILRLGIENQGSGYSDKFSMTVEPSAVGAPGSGFEAALTGGSITNTGEYDWAGGYTILSGGSGYLPELNQESRRMFSITQDSDIKLSAGEKLVVNIDYGTGMRSEDFIN